MVKKMQHIRHFENVIKGVAAALSRNLEALLRNLVPLCYIFAQNLAQVKTQQPATKETFKEMKKNLDYLTFIFSSLSEKEKEEFKGLHELVVQIYRELWPLLR